MQDIISKFIWGGRKARIKASILRLPINEGGLTGPNVTYKHLAMLSAIMQWWNDKSRHCWNAEYGVQVPISDLMLMEKGDRVKVLFPSLSPPKVPEERVLLGLKNKVSK